MIVRRKRGERDLFGVIVQPRLVSPEPKPLYAAIMKLRRSGFQVFRAGRDKHVIREQAASSGKRITTDQLLQLAAGPRCLGWNPNQ